jgi:hypothetical protein
MNPAAPPTTTDDDPGNPSVDFRGEKRSNETHRSIIDPEAMLMRKGKGKEAKLVIMDHALMGNRHGLLIDFQVTQATRTAERDMVSKLLDQAKDRRFDPKTLGGDKRYDTGDCADDMRDRRVAPHVAPNTSNRRSAIDGRTTRHPGYAVSQRISKRVEIVCSQLTKGRLRAGVRCRDDVSDLHIAVGHDHAVDEQLYQLASLFEVGAIQAVG